MPIFICNKMRINRANQGFLYKQQNMGNLPQKSDLSTHTPLLFLSIVDDQIELNQEARQIIQAYKNDRTSFILNYGKPLSGKSSFGNDFLLNKKEGFLINHDKTIKKKTSVWLWNQPLSLPQCKSSQAYLLEWEGDFHARLMETLLSLCSFVIINSIALPQSRKFIDDFEDLLPVVKNFVEFTTNIMKPINIPQFVWVVKDQQASRYSIFEKQKNEESNIMKYHRKDFEKYFARINVVNITENSKQYSYDKILHKNSEYQCFYLYTFRPGVMLQIIDNAINKFPLWLSLYLIKVWEFQWVGLDGVSIRKMDDQIAPIVKEVLRQGEQNKTNHLRLALLNIFYTYINSRRQRQQIMIDYIAGNIPQTKHQKGQNNVESSKICLAQQKIYEITERPTEVSKKELNPISKGQEEPVEEAKLDSQEPYLMANAGNFECQTCKSLQKHLEQERTAKYHEQERKKQEQQSNQLCEGKAEGKELFECLDYTEKIMLKEEAEEITLL